MMDNSIMTLLTIILPLLGGGVGYFINHQLEKKRKLQSRVTNERRELYQRFVDFVIDILRNTKTNSQQDEPEMIDTLFNFYKKYVLYASPQVINSYSDYFQYLYKLNEEGGKMDNRIHFQKLTRIIKAMRTDLGLTNKKLGKDGEMIFRALITDFDKIFEKK